MSEHTFLIDDLGEFITKLEAKDFSRSESDLWISHSKVLSGAIVKYYAYPASAIKTDGPIQIRVTYRLVDDGKPLSKILKKLKVLNERHRRTMNGWKTKKSLPKHLKDRRWADLQRFLHEHAELVSCFKYQADDRLTEGNYSFNLQIASTPNEQRICLEFIKALVEAYNPFGIIWRRRQPDKPVQQRNGWIRREASLLKQQGMRPFEIARTIQKELRNGTWNERSRLQFNIANSTVCKLAGIKITYASQN